MDVDGLAIDEGTIAFLWVTLGGVAEIARADSLLHSLYISAGTGDVQLVTVHDCQQLLADILGAF